MPLIIQDLNQQFPIVDPETGKPSDYFMRYLRDRGGYLSEIEGDIAALIEEFNSRQIIAGVGLDGGGTLAADVTLDLADTAVTPGSYTNTSLTVDPQGRITAASSGSGGGGSGWTLVDQSGAPISSGATWTYASPVASVDIVGLGSYTDLMVVARGLTSSVSGNRSILASVNNGASFYSTSGDYVAVATTGIEAAGSAWAVHDTAATVARSIMAMFQGAGAVAGPKWGQSIGAGNNTNRLFVASTSPVNALRVIPGAAGNFGAGSIYVYAR